MMTVRQPYNSIYYTKHVQTTEDEELFTRIWFATWIEEKYASEQDIVIKYNRYNSYSDDFLLINSARNRVVGSLRIININSTVGLPVLNDFSINRVFDNNEKVCEATLLTVLKEERVTNPNAALVLLIQLWIYVRKKNIDGILIAADRRLWYLLTRTLRLCFRRVGPEQIYEGSLTIPGYLNVLEQKKLGMQSRPQSILEKAFWEF